MLNIGHFSFYTTMKYSIEIFFTHILSLFINTSSDLLTKIIYQLNIKFIIIFTDQKTITSLCPQNIIISQIRNLLFIATLNEEL